MNSPLPADSQINVFFLGSGRLGIPLLQALCEDSRINLVGIGTQPDRPAGRKRRLAPNPIGLHCQENGLDVVKPTSVNDPEILEVLRECSPDIIVVASFGQLLKEEILTLPSFGCFNVHASLLPRWRGASPINAVILNGDEQTGISFMAMDKGLDTGAVYEMVSMTLTGCETAETLETTLAELAATHVSDCLARVCFEGLAPTPQLNEGMTYASKLHKCDGAIDWTHPASVIERQIRGLLPWPKTNFQLLLPKTPLIIQVIEAVVVTVPPGQYRAGDIIQADRQGWIIACGQNALKLERIIPQGRRPMTASDFLRGHPVAAGGNITILDTHTPHETDFN